MSRISLISLWARKRRLASIAVAVVLGVAFLTGTIVIGDTKSADFDRLFNDVSAGTDVVIRNDTEVRAEAGPDDAQGSIDESLLDTVRAVAGVGTAEAQVVGYGSLLGRDGDAIGGNGPPRLAGSWISTSELNPYRIVEGRAPEADDEVVVNRGAAEAGDLQLGDETVVQTPQPVEVTIVGISTFGDLDGLGEVTWTAFTLDAAKRHITGQGVPAGDDPARSTPAPESERDEQVSSILVKAEPGVSSDELRDRVAAALPDGVEAITGTDLAEERTDAIAREFLNMLRTFLVVFAGIALVVAGLSIANTFSITVAQRTRELGLLRAVGASRRQVRVSVLVEALGVGLVASAVGVVAGFGVAELLDAVFKLFGSALPSGPLKITPVGPIAGMAVGVGVTLLAAQSAARRAARLAPMAALRDGDGAVQSISRRRVLVGAVLTTAGIVATLAAALSGVLLVAGLGALVVLVGALMMAPVALLPVAGAVGGALRRLRGVNGMMAEENARRNPRRSAATATALVVGVAVVSMFTVFAASMKATLADQLSGDFEADMAITTPSFGGGQLSVTAADEAADLDEVEAAVGLGGGAALVDGDDTTVTATDAALLEDVAKVDVVDGSLASLETDGIAVDESKAEDEGWQVGDQVELTFADGASQSTTVDAIYADNALVGSTVISEDLWSEHTPQPLARMVLMSLADGVSEDQARRAVMPLADRLGGDVANAEEFAADSTEGFDMLLGIVYVMLALAIIIALLGISNTLKLAVYERRRELGLLRAVGQTRRQVRSVVRLESVIVATFGTLVGLVLGGFLGWAFFATIAATTDIGSTFSLPTIQLVVITVLGASAGVLAARRPARRAARLPILEAIATE